ncbi:MAG TPA: hypothetical protein P5048_04805, partial [Chlamydiales bacterium]|nr:hypothetical protein [Chlamydiales bacterium]
DPGEISPNFEDKLEDIPDIHRKKLSLLYKHNLEKPSNLFTRHLETLRKNSKKRIDQNKNYQDFLNEIKNKKYDCDAVEQFTVTDLQLQECYNIMKDLIFLHEIQNNSFDY